MATDSTWHIISGSWRRLDGDARERLWHLVAERLHVALEFDAREALTDVRALEKALKEGVGIDALDLPIYGGLRDGTAFGYLLVQVTLPASLDDFVELDRWCFFLWDGGGDLVALDGVSTTLHEFNTRIGVDLGPQADTRQTRERVALYLQLFCAFLVAGCGADTDDHAWLSPFLPVTRPDGLPADESLDEVTDEVSDEVSRESAHESSIDESGRAAGHRLFRSAAVGADGCVTLNFGRRLNRAQLEIECKDLEDGRWRTANVTMLDDDGASDDGPSIVPLSVRSWSRRLAFFCRSRGAPLFDAPVTPSRFAALLKDRQFVKASHGIGSALEDLLGRHPGGDHAAERRMFRLIALRYWQVPVGRHPIEVIGDLELAAPGEKVATQIDLDVRVHVRGNFVFAGARFRSPVRLELWKVDGRVDGSRAHVDRSLTLRRFDVRNDLGTPSPDKPGRVLYPVHALKLEELRVGGSLDLSELAAMAAVSLRRAQVDGRSSLRGARLLVNQRDASRPGALNAEHVRVGGSFELGEVEASGQLTIAHGRIGGDVDLSGAHIRDGIAARSASIGGDLVLNRFQPVVPKQPGEEPAIEDLRPTLVGGGIDAENARIRGSVVAYHCLVWGNVDLRGAKIGQNLAVCGLAGTPAGTPYMGALPIAARVTIIRGELSVYRGSVGGIVTLDGTVCRGIDLNFIEATAIFVRPDAGSGLPLMVTGDPDRPSAPCFQLSHARLGGLFAAGVQLGAGMRAVGMQVGKDFRMIEAKDMPAPFRDEGPFSLRLLELARDVWPPVFESDPTSGESDRNRALQAFVAQVKAFGAQAAEPAMSGRVDLPSAVAGDLCLDGLRCGGDLNLSALQVDGLLLEGVHIENRLLLAGEGGDASSPRARISGGLYLRNSIVGGSICLDRCDFGGRVDVRDSDLDGSLSLVDSRLAADASTGSGLRINNIRLRSDVVLDGLAANDCGIEIGDSAITGDLSFQHGPAGAQSTEGEACTPQAVAASLRIVANHIEGAVRLNRLVVRGRLDLTDTRADRGLFIADDSAVVCGSLDLTRFATNADVDLQGLRLGASPRAPGMASDAVQPERPPAWGARFAKLWRAWAARVRDDLTLRDEVPVGDAKPDASGSGSLLARHTSVGGTFSLPRALRAMRLADLEFTRADRLEVAGNAFADGRRDEVALVLRSARVDSARLVEPLPRRVDLREALVSHWDIRPASRDASASPSSSASPSVYLDYVSRSWPFTQAVYTKLEQGYRDGGQHREADRFLAAMAWRTWRWSLMRPAFEGWGPLLLLALAVALAGWAASSFGASRGVLALILVGGLYAMLSTIDVFKRASRFLLGLFIVAPFQLLYGFGIRWWLPLMLSAMLMVFVTVPVLSDCRNLEVPDAQPLSGGQSLPDTQAVSTGSFMPLFRTIGAETDVGPWVVGSCTLSGVARNPGQVDTLRWNLGEAFWLALKYHVPIVSLEGFFNGGRNETVRPAARPLRIDWRGPGGGWIGQIAALTSPIAYARAVYLLSWIVLPFSLLFAAARIQRKFRLQKN